MAEGFRFIGLTGGIGSGKSSVAKVLSGLGLGVVSADALVHEILSTDDEVKKAILGRFGPDVFDSQGQVVRKKLGEKVFSNTSEREWLERLLHPRVRKRVELAKDQAKKAKKPVLFYEVPLLFEKGLQAQFDEIWLVTAPEDLRIQRVQLRDQLSPEEIKKRMANQVSEPVKEKGSQVIFQNLGSLQDLSDQVIRVCKQRGFIQP
jgi:dephospho-CoA kinase